MKALYPNPISFRAKRPFLPISMDAIDKSQKLTCLSIVKALVDQFVTNPDVFEALMAMNIFFVNSDIDTTQLQDFHRIKKTYVVQRNAGPPSL